MNKTSVEFLLELCIISLKCTPYQSENTCALKQNGTYDSLTFDLLAFAVLFLNFFILLWFHGKPQPLELHVAFIGIVGERLREKPWGRAT